MVSDERDLPRQNRFRKEGVIGSCAKAFKLAHPHLLVSIADQIDPFVAGSDFDTSRFPDGQPPTASLAAGR
jgi:hypothetical protein